MNSNVSALDRITPLTHEERNAAYEKARLRVAGDEPSKNNAPKLTDFESHAVGKYPPGMMRVVTGLSLAMLVSSFLPSAMRLHATALTLNASIMTDEPSRYWASIFTVMMAEIGQVIFSLAAAVNQNKTHARLLNAGAFICLAIAVTGNVDAMSKKLWDGTNFGGVFAVLETLAPPCLVLITSYVLKGQLLNAIETRHAAHVKFEHAELAWRTHYEAQRVAWDAACRNAHLTDAWPAHVANALREALRAANRNRVAVVRTLTNEDWYELIQRERDADKWYLRVDSRVQEQGDEEVKRSERVRVVKQVGASGNGRHTGEFDDAVIGNSDGTFTARCPHCDETFVKDSARSAKMALVAHKQKHNASVPALALSANGTH